MGAEMGNSTQKLHARGPIGLREVTTFKYLIHGDGQVGDRELATTGATSLRSASWEVFNPPHIGHLVCAQEACWQLELDKVRADAGRGGAAPRDRDGRRQGGAIRALPACDRGGRGWLSVSRQEIDRAGPSYTVDTLRELREGSRAMISS